MQTGKLHSPPADVSFASLDIAFQTRFVDMPEVFRHEHRQWTASEFVYGIAEYARSGFVGEQNRAAFVDRDDSVRRSLGDDTVPRLAVAKGAFRFQARGELGFQASTRSMKLFVQPTAHITNCEEQS